MESQQHQHQHQRHPSQQHLRHPSHSSSLADSYTYSYTYDSDDHDHDLDPDNVHPEYASSLPPKHPEQSSQQQQQPNTHSTAPSASRDPSPTQSARKQASLAAIHVPSFSAFRSQLPSAIKRPLPAAASLHQPSPRALSFSQAEKSSLRLADQPVRPLSLDNGLPQQAPNNSASLVPSLSGEAIYARPDDSFARSPYTEASTSDHDRSDSIDSRIISSIPSTFSSPQHSGIPGHAKHAHEIITSHAPFPSASSIDSREQSPERSSMNAVQRAPTIQMDYIEPVRRTQSEDSLGAASNSSLNPPRSPIAGGLGSFFGWKSPQKSEGDTSPTTTFSERSLSPIPSPGMVKTLPMDDAEGRRASARLTPHALDINKANSTGGYFENPQTPLLIGDDSNKVHVRELERELEHISQELAGSIRREMDLEDELERIKAEFPMISSSDMNHRRTSDYFSDSGASSTKFPITDVDAKLDQLEKQVRKVEQEKANVKVEAANRLQTELSRRRDLEELVQNLEDQIDHQRGQVGQSNGSFEDKLGELESTLDETKRRLGQEKMTKENVEDLYNAIKQELEKARNEADNLRNEVVPQLKARVEGLEAQAAEHQTLVYDNTRLQQELAALREGGNHSRINSIVEEGVMNPARMSLNRSTSLARSSSLRRGTSVKDRSEGGRQRAGSGGVASADGVKEIEDQRDALHKALKLLIRRYEKQQREHERAVKKLSSTQGTAELNTPKRSVYSKEVAFLKEEVTTLRKRTEDALEGKWQYEKNLSGLKMDLDRAEQETRGLRILLQENDSAMPSDRSASGEGNEDEELKVGISKAENERDRARQIAEQYRKRAQSASEGKAAEFTKSAKRMEELAEQLEKQVQANSELRERLAKAISKGDREQKESTRRIEEMQRRLAGMEDSVLAAQQHSESTLANHDAEIRRIEDASSPHLQRLRLSVPDVTKMSPPSPLLKMSPRLGSKKLSDTSLLEMSRTQMLERKVKELEGLLREAEEDMQLVMQRVNKSQMEVADLQTERDAALTQMNKLQDLAVQERERAEALA